MLVNAKPGTRDYTILTGVAALSAAQQASSGRFCDPAILGLLNAWPIGTGMFYIMGKSRLLNTTSPAMLHTRPAMTSIQGYHHVSR